MNKVASFTAFLFLIASASSPSHAYPQVEMQACMANALNAVASKGLKATYSKVKNYCHCSLIRIMDEGRDINSSLAYCNSKYIF
jgi:hypothetical protein